MEISVAPFLLRYVCITQAPIMQKEPLAILTDLPLSSIPTPKLLLI